MKTNNTTNLVQLLPGDRIESYGFFVNLFFVKEADGHVTMRDRFGNDKVVKTSLFLKYAKFTPRVPWKRFFFESNQFFDHINNRGDWDRLKLAYPELSDGQLLGAREATYGGHRSVAEREEHPNYGFRMEHDGDRTLRDFFNANNMSL